MGGSSGGGGGGGNHGGSNYFDSDAYNANMDAGPNGQSFSFSSDPGGFSGNGDATMSDPTNARFVQFQEEKKLGPSVARAMTNALTSFVGVYNAGPTAYGDGWKSEGARFNPGAMAGAWAGLGLGAPGLASLGANAWDSMNAVPSTPGPTSQQYAETPSDTSPTYMADPNQNYGDQTLQDRLRAAGVRV